METELCGLHINSQISPKVNVLKTLCMWKHSEKTPSRDPGPATHPLGNPEQPRSPSLPGP